MNTSWQCHLCHTVYAPHIDTCRECTLLLPKTEAKGDLKNHLLSFEIDEKEELKNVYTIVAFCEVYNISKGFFYKLLKQNLGPRLMRVGKRVFITVQAAQEWCIKMEAINDREIPQESVKELEDEQVKILSTNQVMKLTGLSRPTLFRYQKEGIFPERRKMGKHKVFYRADEIKEWIAAR